MSALVRVFGVPQSWARIVPGAAVTALVGLSVSLLAVPPAAGSAPLAGAAATQPAAAPDAGELTAPDVVSAATIARLEGEPVEILGERTESRSVYALPDGSRAAGVGSGPVWVRRGGDGTNVKDWAPVDLTLVVGEDGLVRPVAQSADLVLSGGTTPAEAAAAAAASSPVEQTTHALTAPVEDAVAPSPSPSVAPSAASTAQPSATPSGTPSPEPTPASTPDVAPEPPSAPEAPAIEVAPAGEPVVRTQIAAVTDPATGVVTRVAWDGTLPEPRLEGRRATYEQVEPGIDLVLEATSMGFQQFFVVHERPAVGAELSFPLTVSTDGAPVTVGEDGTLSVQTPAGELVGRAGVPYMWDAHSDSGRPYPVTQPRPEETLGLGLPPMPDFSTPGEPGEPAEDAVEEVPAPEVVGDTRIDPLAEAVEIERDVRAVAADQVKVDLVPSEEFLQDPATQYPVVVDPAYDIFNGFDTYVQKGAANDRSQETELRIGTPNGGTNVARTFIHFPTANFANKVVHEAWLNLYNFHSWSCSPRAWTVHSSDPASPASTWANQPGQGAYQYAVSDQTQGHDACEPGYSSVDVTQLAKDWAAQGAGEGYVTVRAANEADNYSYKRFFSANNGSLVPGIWIKYNDLPDPPSGLRVSDSPDGSGNYIGTRSLTPTLSATIKDPDSHDWTFAARFVIQRASDGALVYTKVIDGVGNGSVAQLPVPPGLLQDQTQYAWSVWSRDMYAENPQGVGPRYFTPDLKAPLAPRVSSTAYPADGKWHGPEGQAGEFTVNPSAPDASLNKYVWALDKAPDPNNSPVVALTTGGPSTITVPAASMTMGRHSLRVQAVDRSGNSSGVVEHVFYVGRGGIVAPLTDTRVVSKTRLFVTGEAAFTHVRFEYKRGPDVPDRGHSDPTDDVPAGSLSTSTGGAWTPSPLWGYVPLPGAGPVPAASSYTTWNVAQTLGQIGGPVMVRAVLATDSQGSGVYRSAWITLTVDPNADGAASTAVGPGSVNLLTGDHTLSVTDAEEFGLTLARTTSSRDTHSGYQPQAERLNQTQRDASSTATLASTAATMSVDTTRYHTGGTSLKLTPNGADTNNFMSVSGDVNTMGPGLRAGRTYRVSGWIYVPSATGLTQTYSRALGLTVFTGKRTGAYVEQRTPAPTALDVWQQISIDVTIPPDATEAFIRAYNGAGATTKPVWFDDLSVREIWAPFGKEWSLGTVDAAAGTAYTHITRPYPEVAAVHTAGGGEVWFTSGNGGVTWWPEPGAEDLKLTITAMDTSTPALPLTWRLGEIDGTTTDFARDKEHQNTVRYGVTTTSAPGSGNGTRHVYSTTVAEQSRLSRIIAPIEDGVDRWPGNREACNPPAGTALAPGCEVMELHYAAATDPAVGAVAGQVESVGLWTTDPSGEKVTEVLVARYRYDAAGRLIEVWDPRISPGRQVTTYAYDGANRVMSVTAPGEEPFKFTYGKAGAPTQTGSGDVVDNSTGRLLNVARRSLQPGTTDQWGPDNVSTVVYGVPLNRAKGGPYDLDAAALATWAQGDGPTDATAVFGPQDVPGATTATATVPGTGGYTAATVHYLNADGREVNTASPVPNDQVYRETGFIDTAEYDRFGNVVRTLDATNRLLALGKLGTDEQSQLASWNLQGTGSVYLAQILDSRTVYSTDGLDVLASRGPAQHLAVGNNADELATMFPVTRTLYDQDKPDGAAYHLPTTQTSGSIDLGADLLAGPWREGSTTVTKNTYKPVDGADVLGGSSGWVHKQPTQITIDAGQPTALTSTVVYDTKGRPLRSSKPGSNGADPTTTLTVLYTAGTNPTDAACGGKPQWAGQPCLTKAAGPAAVAAADAGRVSANLPVKKVTGYNQFGSPTTVTETATGPLAGKTTEQSRQTITEYDPADRIISVHITGEDTGAGKKVAKTRTVYDEATGEVIRNEAISDTGTVTAAVTKTFDKLGRLVKYTDGARGTTTTQYDRFGQPSKATDSVDDGFGERTIGETTYTYDRTKDPRGFVTSFTDSVAGTFEATWGPDGQLQTQNLPGGVTLSIKYDPARVPVSRTYTRTSDKTLITGDSVIENDRGQWVRHTSNAGERNYTYDRLGRLTKVRDISAATQVCTTRTYGFISNKNPGSANRTSFGTASGAAEAGCIDPTTASTASSTYDNADRLLTSPGTAGSSWSYDPLGRVTSMATPDGSATVANGFYVNDLVASQTQPNVEQMSWKLDPLQRRSVFESKKWVNNAWASAITKVSHYGSDSDEPSWIQEDSTLPDDLTRYVAGVEGDLAVTTKGQNAAGDKRGRVLQLVDLHGDVTATLPIADNATDSSWAEFRGESYDEFGVPQQLSGAGATTGPPARYGWLGAAQRSAEALGGVILMGVRLYSAATGRFLSVDPVAGGSASAYDYCNADPVNCTDLAGTFSWKGALKTLAVVGEVASFIPGPIGAAAAAVSSVAYLATGNKAKALEMGVTAAAQLVGAGPAVRVGFKVANTARKAGQATARAASKTARATVAVSRKVASSARQTAAKARERMTRPQSCSLYSFEAGTMVRMADGTLKPIENIQYGDLVLATDPLSGLTRAEPVLEPIKDIGLKHLYELRFGDSGQAVTVTAQHPFWVEGQGWTEAQNIEPGASVRSSDQTLAPLRSSANLGLFRSRAVYNLSVAGAHTYYVAVEYKQDALVHNCPRRKKPSGNDGGGRGGMRRLTPAELKARGIDAHAYKKIHLGDGPNSRFDIAEMNGELRIVDKKGRPVDG